MSMTQMYKQAHLAASVPTPTPAPMHTPHRPYPPQTPLQRHPSSTGSASSSQPQAAYYNTANPSVAHQQAALQIQQQLHRQQQLFPPATPTTFHLPDQTTEHIPPHIRSQFMTDQNGRMLWFSVPPVAEEPLRAPLSHSVQYLAKKKEIEERKRKRKEEKAAEDEERRKVQRDEIVDIKKAAEKTLVKALQMWDAKPQEMMNDTGAAAEDVEMSG